MHQYNQFNRFTESTDKFMNTSIFMDTNIANTTYTNTVYTDDFVSPANLLATKEFSTFPLFSIFSFLDESYESLKYLNYLFFTNNKLTLNFFNFNLQPYNSLFVFDAFRADYEDFA
jgi:hypothetical protein